MKKDVITKYDDSDLEQKTKWNIRRLQILDRDKYKCTKCGSGNSLQVHHILYDNRLKYWEYTGEYLQTLCKSCHSDLHNKLPLASFYSKKRLPKQTGMAKLYKELIL